MPGKELVREEMKTPQNWEDPTPVPIMASCKQAARLVSISFERPLTLREWFSMRLHLIRCKTCTFYGRQIKALRAIFTRHEEVLTNTPASNDEKLSDQAKQHIKNLIDPK
jgi:hypothetical protein